VRLDDSGNLSLVGYSVIIFNSLCERNAWPKLVTTEVGLTAGAIAKGGENDVERQKQQTCGSDHWRQSRIGIGNRGLGLETVRQLAKRDIRVIVTCRNASRGEIAFEKLLAEGLDVVFHPLDVTSESSVAELGAFIHSRCGRVDILVNNAGVNLDSHGTEDAGSASVFNASLETLSATLKTNLYGPLLLAQELVPLMKQQHYGRIVNVSSGMGQLSEMDGKSPAYRISKTALNALTRILAAETRGFNILVNSVCPGWVRTDMGGPNAERTVEQGVSGIVWAATLPDDPPLYPTTDRAADFSAMVNRFLGKRSGDRFFQPEPVSQATNTASSSAKLPISASALRPPGQSRPFLLTHTVRIPAFAALAHRVRGHRRRGRPVRAARSTGGKPTQTSTAPVWQRLFRWR